MPDREKLAAKAEWVIERATGPGEQRVGFSTGATRIAERGDDAEARRLADVERRGREKLEKLFADYREEAASIADEWAQAPRPKVETLRERLEDARGRFVEEAAAQTEAHTDRIDKARDKYRDQLPDWSEPADPGTEREIRSVLRETEGSERSDLIRELTRNGSEAARRALFNPDVPATMAGFTSEEHRAEIRDRTLKREAPEIVSAVEALESATAGLDQDFSRFEVATREVVKGV